MFFCLLCAVTTFLLHSCESIKHTFWFNLVLYRPVVGQAWQKKSWREAGEQEIDRLEEGTKRYEKDLRRNEEEIQRKDLRKREDGLPREDWGEGVRSSFNVSN